LGLLLDFLFRAMNRRLFHWADTDKAMNLEVRGVEKTYDSPRGPMRALLPTSFEVGDGEFVTLGGTVRLWKEHDTLRGCRPRGINRRRRASRR
jgi:hypothetical protein